VVAAIVTRDLVAAGAPVRATTGTFAGPPPADALFLNGLGPAAVFSATGPAATLFGVTAAQGSTRVRTVDRAHGGPWDLTAGATPELHLVVQTPVEIRLGDGVAGIPDATAAAAAEVRAAINRQLEIGAAFGVRAEPRIPRLTVRRSATEAAASRIVSGSYAFAELVGSPAAIPSPDTRLERLRALAAQDRDALTGGQQNFLYARLANIGTVRGDPARVRVFEVDTAPPFTVTRPPLGTADEIVAVGQSAVVEVPVDLGARPSGSRVFVLAVADTTADVLEPPQTFSSLDDAHRFCNDQPGAAMREFVVA
jgi:hypothetical protein